MDINKAYQLLEDFPFLQTARIAKVIQSANGHLTDKDRLELWLYRGNPFLLSYRLKHQYNTSTLADATEKDTTTLIQEETSQPIELSLDTDLTKPSYVAETVNATPNAVAPDVAKTEPESSEVIIPSLVQESPTDVPEPSLETAKEKIEIPQTETIDTNDSFYEPVYTNDLFLHEGIKVENEIDNGFIQQEQRKKEGDVESDETSLMVTRTFMEWLQYYKEKKKKDERETREKESLRAMWQKEKLTAAIEEENEVVPEQVFKMAINSINEDAIVPSESLAEIYVNQLKYDKAADMYRKLSLLNPEKSAYFAAKIKNLDK